MNSELVSGAAWARLSKENFEACIEVASSLHGPGARQQHRWFTHAFHGKREKPRIWEDCRDAELATTRFTVDLQKYVLQEGITKNDQWIARPENGQRIDFLEVAGLAIVHVDDFSSVHAQGSLMLGHKQSRRSGKLEVFRSLAMIRRCIFWELRFLK